ncbi:tape measure protein [Amycolatopsis sp. CFH S0078]|uniref:tape measure protein n=1 Tax=Amycolatopsis sp. CFH S0078 TaxID=1644108 RepID=UPI00106E7427|nr:tape measure protein [Amycolatopsis sp. CFH S0078]
MAYSAGAAYVQLLPSLRGFGSSAASQINSQLSGVGVAAGEQVGRRLGSGMDTGLSGTLARLRTRFDEVGRSGSQSMTTVARGTAPVLDQLARVSPVLGRVRDGFSSSQVAASAFSGAAGTVGGRLRSVADQAGRMAATSESAFSRTGAAIRSGLMAPIRGAGSVLAGFGITAGTVFTGAGVAAVGMGVRFAASQEQAQMAFTTMLGSAQKAQGFVAQLQDFAAKTPFDLPSVTTGAQRLMAFGFQARDVLPTLTAIGDAVAGMGGSAEQINQVVIAIGQMSAKGKVQGDEILQLTEAGIPALRILANQYGVTTIAMQDMVSKGLVPSAEAIPKLMSGIEQGTKGAAGETQAFAGMMSNQATTLTGIWSNFSDNFNRAMGQLVAPALPAIKTALNGLTDALGEVPSLLQSISASPLFQVITGALRSALSEVVGGVRAFFAAWRDGGTDLTSSGLAGFMESVGLAARNVWNALQPVVSLFGQIAGAAVVGAWRLLGQILGDYVAPALITVSTWVRPLTPVIVGVAAAFATWYGIAAAVGAVTKAISLVRSVILAVRIAWLALQLAFVTSPIGFVIALVAALVAGVVYAWTHFEGFRDVVMACWRAIQTAALWAWQNAIKPAFDGLVAGAVAVGRFFVMLWDGAVAAFRAIGAAASWLWSNVLSPVFNFIGLAARVLIAIVVTVLVTPFVIAFRVLAAIATWLWGNVLSPVFGFIGAAAVWLWTNAIKPVVDFIVGYYRMWAAIGLWLWRNAIQPAFEGIGAAISWAYNSVILPVIDFIVAAFRLAGSVATWLWRNVIVPAFDGIGSAISWAYNNIVLPTFNALRAALSAVGAAFSWVYEHIVRPAWSALGSAIRWVYDNVIVPCFEAVKGAVHAVGQAFDSAVTWIGQIWDKIKGIAAVPVNFVIDWVYNKGIRAVWNWVADFLGLGKLAEATPIKFAGGGVIPGFAPGRDEVPALLSRGESVLTPEATRMVGAENVLALNAAASGRPATVLERNGFSGGGVARFAGGGVIDTILSFAKGIGENVVALFKDPIAWVKSHIGFADSPWITMLAKMPGELIGKAVDWLWSKLNPFSSGEDGAPTVGGDLLGWIHAAMGLTGVPANWEGPLRTLIMRESGGNPRAANMWDINAQRGDPSRGLMQTIGATFRAYRDPRLSADIYDPIANIVAGINYIKARYGTIFNVQQAVGSTPRGYDQGGWLPPGLSTVYNGTGQPEAVFTREQYEAIVGRIQAAGNARPITVYARTDADPEHIAHVIDRRLSLGARL